MDDSRLEGILNFSPADLEANRGGRLSSGQRTRLLWSGMWRLLVGPPLLIAAVLLAVLPPYALISISALGFAGFALYLVWRGFAFVADSFDGAVGYVTADLTHWLVHGRYGISYWAGIGPVSKQIRKSAYDSFPPGLRCHLYYSPGCRSLLSVEPADAAEPKPEHPFGADSAHVWDRIRWSWVLAAVGVLGVLVAAHAILTAHPAHPVMVGGTVADYIETHGKSTTRHLYLQGDSDYWTVQSEDSYSPPMPVFSSLIGHQVALYYDDGTRDVIALDDREVVHGTDWYLHPDHEKTYGIFNGAAIGAASLVSIAAGIALAVAARRQMVGRVARLAPPTVRPVQAQVPGLVVLAGVCVVFAAVALVIFGPH